MVEDNLVEPVSKLDNKKKVINLIIFVIGAIIVFCLLMAFTGLAYALTIFDPLEIPTWQSQAQFPFAVIFILYLIGIGLYYFYHDKITAITRRNDSAVIQISTREIEDLVFDEAKYFRIRLGRLLHTRYVAKGEAGALSPIKFLYYECLNDSTQTKIGVTKWQVNLLKKVVIDLADRFTIDRETKQRELHGDSKEEIKTRIRDSIGSKKRKDITNIHGDEDDDEEN